MAHQVIWTRRVTLFFEQMAQLNEVQKQILESRIAGMTVKQMSIYYSMSQRTIGTIVQRLKRKYDEVQQQYPDDLKPRKTSAIQTYMDEH